MTGERSHGSEAPTVVAVGMPSALGGWLPGREPVVRGMASAPGELRAAGFLERVRFGLRSDTTVEDAGDASIEPPVREDRDPRSKNRALLLAALPVAIERMTDALRTAGPEARLLAIGGDCTTHAVAVAALRRARPDRRLAMAWFDAHGDFNTPETTPSGDVWGMPFAMACGRGDPDLVAACDGPTVSAEACALIGGQVLDEAESRMLATSGVAHFGPGMLATDAGLAALAAWAAAVARDVDGFYLAIDHDALDSADGWAVATPEPGGLSLDTAVAAIRALSSAGPIFGYGATAMSLGNGDAGRTVAGAASLAIAALGSPAA